MRKSLKILAILLLILASGFAALYGYIWYRFHHYWEAEPKVEPVWAISHQIRQRIHDRLELPKSLNELIATLEPAQLEKIKDYPMIWRPDSDPMFVIRINAKHGFQIDRGGSPAWIWERAQVKEHFPAY
ncbi:MAG: hypothetical protein V4662_22430 [Verrucomicrobiota bacterium]